MRTPQAPRVAGEHAGLETTFIANIECARVGSRDRVLLDRLHVLVLSLSERKGLLLPLQLIYRPGQLFIIAGHVD